MKRIHQTHRRNIAVLCLFSLALATMSGNSDAAAKRPKLSKKKLSILQGKTATLKIRGAKGAKITWKLKKKKMATVKKSGKYALKIKGKKVGSTKLTVKVRTKKKTYRLNCKITVKMNRQKNTAAPASTAMATTKPETSSLPTITGTPESSATPVITDKPEDNGKPATTVAPQNTNTPAATVAPQTTNTPAATVAPQTTNTPVVTAPSATTSPTIPPVVSDNQIVGATASKNNYGNVTSVIENGEATATFTEATQYHQANFTLGTPIDTAKVLSFTYKLNVTGTPDNVTFKLLGPTTDIAISCYNKTSGSYTVEMASLDREVLRDCSTITGFAIMTNTNIKGAETQTATAVLESLTFSMMPETTPTVTDRPNVTDEPNTTDVPVTTDVPATSDVMTFSSQTFLGSGVITEGPTYNSDGSVTFTAGNGSSGGGVGFYLNADKSAIDLSSYSQVSFTVSATDEVPITLLYYTGTEYWSGRHDISYPSAATEQKTITYDIPQGTDIYGFGVKYNTNSGTASLPETATITIHSITLKKDLRDITDATTNYEKLYELASPYGFKMGTAIGDSKITDAKYTDLMSYHFNSITATNEMKAYSMLDENGSKNAYVDESSMPVINFTKADKIAQYAKDNNMGLRGHVLVWDADMCDWFFREGYDTSRGYASETVMKARLQNYIEQVITHFEEEFPGVIYCWDVVNEAVGDSSDQYASGDNRHVRTVRNGVSNLFYDHIGKDYVELSFQYAHEVVESLGVDIDLYYNDYNTFLADKRDAICNLIDSINNSVSDGTGGYVKLCDGVGMQSYIGGYGQQSGCMNDADIAKVKTAIEMYAAHGVDVQATELAVRNYQGDATTQAKHGAFYKKLFEEAYIAVNEENPETKPLKAVCIWGIIDIPTLDEEDYSYRMNGPYCGLFDETYGVKDSFINIHNLMNPATRE